MCKDVQHHTYRPARMQWPFFLILIAGLTGSGACTSSETHQAVVVIDTAQCLKFQLGFPIYAMQCGTLEDCRTGERTFYFANTNNGRVLKRFDDEGCLLQTVPLAAGVDSLLGLSVLSLVMQTPDSIFLFSDYSNEGNFFVLVDGRGNVLRSGGLSDALVDSLHYAYELQPAAAGHYRFPGGLLFEVRCNGQRPDTTTYASAYDDLRAFDSRTGRAAHMAMFHLDAKGPSFAFDQYGFYNKYCAHGDTAARDWIEGPGYTCIDNKVYHISMYTPWVYRLDDRLAVIDSFLVRSDIGPCHVELPVLSEMESQHGQDSVNVRLNTRNYITSVIPCPPLNAVLVQVMKGAPASESDKPDWRPEWSWVINDTNGVRLSEKQFAGGTYDGWCVLWNKDCAWVKRASTPKEQREGTFYFDRFTLAP